MLLVLASYLFFFLIFFDGIQFIVGVKGQQVEPLQVLGKRQVIQRLRIPLLK
jgi:hypothetical protein